MSCDRNEMLSIFLANNELKQASSLDEETLIKVNFRDSTDDLVVESLKSLIMSFCKKETQPMTLRQINLRIDSLSNDRKGS